MLLDDKSKLYTLTLSEIGTEILIPLGIDIKALDVAATIVLLADAPDGTTKSWTASFTPLGSANGPHHAKYTWIAGDLDQAGIWYITPKVSWSGGTKSQYLGVYRLRVREQGQV
jgi:hypothetical protein